MIGNAHPAGFKGRQVRPDVGKIAGYFSASAGRLAKGLESLETGELPGILLVQHPDREAKIGAAVFLIGLVESLRTGRKPIWESS